MPTAQQQGKRELRVVILPGGTIVHSDPAFMVAPNGEWRQRNSYGAWKIVPEKDVPLEINEAACAALSGSRT